MSDIKPQQFRCISLYDSHPLDTFELDQIPEKCITGVHDFFVPQSELPDKDYRERFFDLLVAQYPIKKGQNGLEWRNKEFKYQPNQFIRLFSQNNIKEFHQATLSYYQGLRANLYEKAIQTGIVIAYAELCKMRRALSSNGRPNRSRNADSQ